MKYSEYKLNKLAAAVNMQSGAVGRLVDVPGII